MRSKCTTSLYNSYNLSSFYLLNEIQQPPVKTYKGTVKTIKLYTRNTRGKQEKSTLSMLFLNAVRVEKLTVDGSAFQTLTTLSAKKLLPEIGCTSGLKQFVLVTPCISDGAKFKEITEVYIYQTKNNLIAEQQLSLIHI